MTEALEVTLARIEEKVISIDDKLGAHMLASKEKADDHERRIRWNERFRNFALGALGLGGSSLGLMEWFK